MKRPSSEQVATFRASLWWSANLIGAALMAVVVAPCLFLIGLWKHWDFIDWYWGIASLLLVVAYLAGTVGAILPYAVEVHPNRGLRLLAPFSNMFIPLGDLAYLERSSYAGGFTVGLTRRHGLVTRFIIPWYFGRQREALCKAIEEIIDRKYPGP